MEGDLGLYRCVDIEGIDWITGSAGSGCGAALHVGASVHLLSKTAGERCWVKEGWIYWAYGFVLFLLGRAARCIFFTPLGLYFFFGGPKWILWWGKGKWPVEVECMC